MSPPCALIGREAPSLWELTLASHSKQTRKMNHVQGGTSQPGLSPRVAVANETGARRWQGSGSRSPRGVSVHSWGLVHMRSGGPQGDHTAPPRGSATNAVSELPRVPSGCLVPAGPRWPLPAPPASGSPWEAPRAGGGDRARQEPDGGGGD